jgi:SAM-dependent methyltransferase
VDNAINTSERLHQRIACNGASSASFDDFVLRLLDPGPEDAALDLGPGLGQQLVPVAQRVRRAVGVEVSAEIAAALRCRVIGANAEVVLGDMDHLGELDLGGPFTLAYSVYSLYYSADPARVVRAVTRLLGGARARLVVVAPDAGNNAAWFADLRQLFELPADVLASPGLCRDVMLPALLDAFPRVDRQTFACEVRFEGVDALMRYYDACAPYCRPDRRAEARDYFARKFERDGEYRIAKRSLGLVGHAIGEKGRASPAGRRATASGVDGRRCRRPRPR